MPDSFDIVIAGGGMVGVSLALQLDAVLPPHTSILLVEGFQVPSPVEGGVPDYHPAFDARSTALIIAWTTKGCTSLSMAGITSQSPQDLKLKESNVVLESSFTPQSPLASSFGSGE